jgi:hypothetical protein
METNINLKHATLHILDNVSGTAIFSDVEIDTSEDMGDYLSKHIAKVMEDPGVKNAFFADNESDIFFLSRMLAENENDFLPISKDIANKLFILMQKHIDISPADFLCCLFEADNCKYLGLLKLNYKTAFTHWVENIEDGYANKVIKHKALLPQEGQKLEECIIVNLENFSIKILEKQYEINGEKDFYLSKYFLKCSCGLSDNAKVKIIDKVTKNINKKYFEEDFEKALIMKKAVNESLEKSSAIQIDQVAGKIYESELNIRNEYVEEIAKAGISENEIILPEKLIEKRFKNHKIKTDTGIYIYFPVEFAGNNEKIEFINNPDGTTSIIIRNIGKIINGN